MVILGNMFEANA